MVKFKKVLKKIGKSNEKANKKYRLKVVKVEK
jgi:hypothetical protein